MFEFKLPDVGEGMHEAEILRWLVAPGDTVKVDQPMLEIQTDKAVVEIPAPVSGKVGEIKAPVGKISHVGDVLIVFNTGAPASPAQPAAKAAGAQPVEATAEVRSQSITGTGGAGRVKAAPAVRKRAVELDVDINRVPPSSPDGRVLLKDVEEYAANQTAPATSESNGHSPKSAAGQILVAVPASPSNAAAPARLAPAGSEERKPLAGLRRRIAERMELSWRTIPHATCFDEADGSNLVALRGQLKPAAQQQAINLTYTPLIIKAVVQTLKRFPVFNASLDEQTREIIYKGYYHIGIATATPDGLLVPVVRDADRLTLLELSAEVNRLSEGGRSRTLKSNELSGSTFTISNVGSFGGSTGTAIINPPEAAILVTGSLKERPMVVNGELVKRPTLPLSMSFDHRLIDGAEAGTFLAALKEVLENPSLLLLNAV
ncbi:MAG: 2-oxo acid dehydrogenase subunit [Chloroflexi bacterium]|nr:2-oxo acid dehydrogenase subunit [Chloroflexota bacterium]